MNREDILQVLVRINEAIASLNGRLHPPPAVERQSAELLAELTAAEGSRATLEQMLNNLPEPVAGPALAMQGLRSGALAAQQMRASNKAAISLSKTVRQHAKQLQAIDAEAGKHPLGPKKSRRAASSVG